MSKPAWIYLAAAARKVWRWTPERREALKKSAVPVDYWLCAKCKKVVPRVQVDHIVPVGPAPKSFDGWDDFYKRLFCEASNLRALCVPCHKEATKKQAKGRAKAA